MQEVENTTKERVISNNWLAYGLVTCLCVGLFLSGIKVGSGANASDQMASLWSLFVGGDESVAVSPSAEPDMTEFWEVWNALDQKFANSSSTETLTNEAKIEGAINGLVRAYGDPYTVYLPPADSEAFNEDISGEFSGVGMEVGLRDGLVTIISPLPDTPAETAGLLAGDVIVRIDDETTENMRIDQAVKLIRGEKGTEVVLTVFREGEADFLEIPVVRDTIVIPTVKYEKRGDVFVITLYSFNAIAEARMREALQEYLESDSERLILDLRGNPGGYLQGAVSIAGYFMPAGMVVVREQFSGDTMEDVYRTRANQIRTFTPDNLVVLVDNGSASASEILAGALQDHGIATVLGTKTFGKGSVQQLIDLKSGAALKVTIARWVTPSGISISEGGLTPDILISRTPQQRLAGEDPQLEAAERFLAGEEVASETFEGSLVSADNETGE